MNNSPILLPRRSKRRSSKTSEGLQETPERKEEGVIDQDKGSSSPLTAPEKSPVHISNTITSRGRDIRQQTSKTRALNDVKIPSEMEEEFMISHEVGGMSPPAASEKSLASSLRKYIARSSKSMVEVVGKSFGAVFGRGIDSNQDKTSVQLPKCLIELDKYCDDMTELALKTNGFSVQFNKTIQKLRNLKPDVITPEEWEIIERELSDIMQISAEEPRELEKLRIAAYTYVDCARVYYKKRDELIKYFHMALDRYNTMQQGLEEYAENLLENIDENSNTVKHYAELKEDIAKLDRMMKAFRRKVDVFENIPTQVNTMVVLNDDTFALRPVARPTRWLMNKHFVAYLVAVTAVLMIIAILYRN